jgi:hypothetical protein
VAAKIGSGNTNRNLEFWAAWEDYGIRCAKYSQNLSMELGSIPHTYYSAMCNRLMKEGLSTEFNTAQMAALPSVRKVLALFSEDRASNLTTEENV